jgi:hypothetical protein
MRDSLTAFNLKQVDFDMIEHKNVGYMDLWGLHTSPWNLHLRRYEWWT